MNNEIIVHRSFFSYCRCYFLLFAGLLMVRSSIAQNFDTVQIKSTKLTAPVYELEGSGGNAGVCIDADGR